jgi:hypothetical protein
MSVNYNFNQVKEYDMAEENVEVPEQEVEEKEPVMVTLTLSVEEVNQALKILGEASFKDVNGLIQKIYTQGSQQVQQDSPE